ncbi:AIR carboxylase family protein [Candidatus Woesearchaeota archaeon]|nr:AIR carboxylase family protein [Candidatus Woesearchaeota archaeon]
MGTVLVIFASKSNKAVYDRVVSRLKELNAPFELRICSAHKSPGKLDEILNGSKPSAIIAGAGMAAHLAGAIAARTMTPVIGVPCSDNFNGLDALLSTLQMPPGIPVLSVGIDAAEEAADAAALIAKGWKKVSVLVKSPYAERSADMLKRLNVQYELSYILQDDCINIRFVSIAGAGKVGKPNGLTINCPVKENTSAKDALKLASIKNGIWVSLNRADNAAVAAAEIVGNNKALADYRKEIAAAVINADKEESKK